MKKTIGILGGMGPLATCDLMNKIISRTDAACDQEHLHICVDCNTNIPDRTAAILRGGKNPVEEMTKSAVALEKMGAELILVSCNTAHYFVPQVQQSISVPILHMPEETAKYMAEKGVRCAGILATDGTVQSRIYHMALEKFGITPLQPDTEDQKLIMTLIYDYVKAGKPIDLGEEVLAMCQRLQKAGAEMMILGCTELPIVFDQLKLSVPTVDPTDVLATTAIRLAGGRVKKS